MLNVTSSTADPYILALVQLAKQKYGDGNYFIVSYNNLSSPLFCLFFLPNFLCYYFPTHFIFTSFAAYYVLTNVLKYHSPCVLFRPCFLTLTLTAPIFLYPLISSPLPFSALKPSSEKPISLHRGWGCEGKPKWNAAHLLE